MLRVPSQWPPYKKSVSVHPVHGNPRTGLLRSGVNKSARERIGRQNLSQKVPSKKASLGVIFSPRNYRENAHSKSANFEGRHSGGHLLGRPLLFTSDSKNLLIEVPEMASAKMGVRNRVRIDDVGSILKFRIWGTGGILFREYCLGEENSLTSLLRKLGEFCEKLSEFAFANK